MQITSFGSHVSSRVCASFAVLENVGQSLLSTLLQLDVRIQVGLCSGPYFLVQVLIFFHAVVGGVQASSRFSAVAALSPCRQIPGARSTADRQAACQLASTQASTSKNESTKVFVPLAHDCELVDLLARKVVLWITPSSGKDAQTEVRRPPSRTCGEVVSLRKN